MKRDASDRIAINYLFITVTMRLQSIDFLRLLKIRVAVFKCLGHFIKKVNSHNFASTERPASYIFRTSLKFWFKCLT